jgi:hypothetical protein
VVGMKNHNIWMMGNRRYNPRKYFPIEDFHLKKIDFWRIRTRSRFAGNFVNFGPEIDGLI